MVNSAVATRRAALLKRLETLRRWAERARETHERATTRDTKRWQATKEYGEVLYRDLNRRLCALETHDLLPHELQAQRRELTRAAEDEMAERWACSQRARRESNVAFHKQELTVRSFLRRFARFTLNTPSITRPTPTKVAFRHQKRYHTNVFSR